MLSPARSARVTRNDARPSNRNVKSRVPTALATIAEINGFDVGAQPGARAHPTGRCRPTRCRDGHGDAAGESLAGIVW